MKFSSMFNNQDLIAYICLFFFVFLSQQATYIVSSLFVGIVSFEYIFGNTSQMVIFSFIFSSAMLPIYLIARRLLEKAFGYSIGDLLMITAVMLAVSLVLFIVAIWPMSVPFDQNYRGCTVRIAGELTSCGFWSAASDLLAMLLVSATVALVFRLVKPHEV